MKAGAKALILTAVLLGGCRATRDVAVTSYHVTRGVAVGSYRVTRGIAVGSYRVATAPVKILRGRSDEPPQTTTTTTTSALTTPGPKLRTPILRKSLLFRSASGSGDTVSALAGERLNARNDAKFEVDRPLRRAMSS